MKKTLFLPILLSALLFSCGSGENTTTNPELTEEEQFESANLELLSEEDLAKRMEKIEQNLMDEKSLEVSKKQSILMLEAGKKHLERFPDSPNRREIIRKTSKAAQGLNQDYEAINLLEMSIKEFGQDTSIIEEMNVRAFLFDKIDNKVKAREAYTEIIEKFPNHPMSEMHKARLNTLDMTEEELVEWLEKQNAE